MVEQIPPSRQMHEFYKRAQLEKGKSDLVRSQNVPLEVVRKLSERIHFFTDNGWRSTALTMGILIVAYLSTIVDGKIVTDGAALVGGGLGGHSVAELVGKIQDKRRKNKVIKKASKGENINVQDLVPALEQHADIQPPGQMRKWIDGFEPVGLIGESRAALLRSIHNAKCASIDSMSMKSPEREKLKIRAREELLRDTVAAIVEVQKQRRESSAMRNEILKNLSFIIGEGLLTLGATVFIDRSFHNDVYTSVLSIADDIPTALVIMASPLIEKLSKLVSYPTLLKVLKKTKNPN